MGYKRKVLLPTLLREQAADVSCLVTFSLVLYPDQTWSGHENRHLTSGCIRVTSCPEDRPNHFSQNVNLFPK